MLQLHTMAPAYGLPTFTPFGLKVMAHLRLAQLPFEVVVEHVPGRGPKKKFPWLTDGDVVIADSAFIVDYLVEHHGAALDDDLPRGDRARAHALRRMIEEGLCFCIAYTRWVDRAVCETALPQILAAIPQPARGFIAPLVRRRILRDLWGQGVARYTPSEVTEIGTADLCALSTQLADGEFMLGERPTSLDAVAAAFLAVILYPPLDTPLQRELTRFPNLVAYCDRMRALCFDSPG